ncbi:hypothetical protein [Bosea vaviloviae]|uniref:hypothetical protein n=1 Tax=Bosea vaviloviae TaxID=1526658 RepID=UPI001314A4EF|nr:hypothetical protein [Bosea vaviloviae]
MTATIVCSDGLSVVTTLSRRHIALIVAAAFILVIFAALLMPQPIWRYRLTVDVDTPEGMRSGSGVIQVKVDRGRRRTTAAGEAVMVDLGKRGSFFVLLRSEQNADNAVYIYSAAFPGPAPGTPEGISFYHALRAEANVPESVMPMFVRLYDLSNPRSLARVEKSNLSASFGKGVNLKAVRIEMVSSGIPIGPLDRLTGTPVTRTLRSKIPWLSDYPEPRLVPVTNPYDYAPMSNLVHGDFSKW